MHPHSGPLENCRYTNDSGTEYPPDVHKYTNDLCFVGPDILKYVGDLCFKGPEYPGDSSFIGPEYPGDSRISGE